MASPPPSHLDKIQNQGILRVGTTGDYPPFTQLDSASQTYTGSDIEAARALGSFLGVPVQFVQTSWPTLIRDLSEDRFDIGMGGISITRQRKKMAYFSTPYLQDGKVPLVRCTDLGKFKTLKAINKPSVRLIENPGGTNEAFARSRLKHVSLILHPQNEELFQYLLTGQADVMITDSTEARLQEKQHPGLCAVDPTHPLQKEQKGYLLPKGDRVFQNRVNQWLRKWRRSTGS